MTGYSGRTAAEKVGLRAGMRLGLLGAPEGWHLDGLPEGVQVCRDLRSPRDVTLAFVRSAAEVRQGANDLERGLDDGSSLWVCWPRRAAGHRSDVTEDLLREVFLPPGLVDVKVAAVDDDWSGLKLVRRKELRGNR